MVTKEAASETPCLVEDTRNVFMDTVYGVTMVRGNHAGEARGAMSRYVNEHRNKEGAQECKFLEVQLVADLLIYWAYAASPAFLPLYSVAKIR